MKNITSPVQRFEREEPALLSEAAAAKAAAADNSAPNLALLRPDE